MSANSSQYKWFSDCSSHFQLFKAISSIFQPFTDISSHFTPFTDTASYFQLILANSSHNSYFIFLEWLGVGLRPWSCVLKRLLPLGANGLQQPHSGWHSLQDPYCQLYIDSRCLCWKYSGLTPLPPKLNNDWTQVIVAKGRIVNQLCSLSSLDNFSEWVQGCEGGWVHSQ